MCAMEAWSEKLDQLHLTRTTIV